MQQIRATLTPFTLRSRSIRVGHTGSGLTGGLDHGEHVLVHDPVADVHHTAVVAEIDFELDDTSYRLDLGTRITAAEADEWMRPTTDRPADRVTTPDIVDLLGQLRRSEKGLRAAFAELAEG
ncbi:MAG: hypothetical protein FWE71_12540 [Nocardioidaceae bacterium]|nr:hypothetical protein [Nocardioidaceae bacterium]MCL2613267.1 hypothetical protein [Nocardioidaceae bacterium]